MSKAEPQIQKFMTCQPHAIEASESVEVAAKMLVDLQIRHLPVMAGDKIVGVLSDRDIKTAMSLISANPVKLSVRDICHEHAYEVSPTALLHDVVLEMASKKIGSAIVVQNGKLVGIFTTVDVCRALASILDQRFHSHW